MPDGDFAAIVAREILEGDTPILHRNACGGRGGLLDMRVPVGLAGENACGVLAVPLASGARAPTER